MGLYCGYNALELKTANYLQINEITPKSSHFLATFPNLGSISIQKGHGATYHWGQLIMHDRHLVQIFPLPSMIINHYVSLELLSLAHYIIGVSEQHKDMSI